MILYKTEVPCHLNLHALKTGMNTESWVNISFIFLYAVKLARGSGQSPHEFLRHLQGFNCEPV